MEGLVSELLEFGGLTALAALVLLVLAPLAALVAGGLALAWRRRMTMERALALSAVPMAMLTAHYLLCVSLSHAAVALASASTQELEPAMRSMRLSQGLSTYLHTTALQAPSSLVAAVTVGAVALVFALLARVHGRSGTAVAGLLVCPSMLVILASIASAKVASTAIITFSSIAFAEPAQRGAFIRQTLPELTVAPVGVVVVVLGVLSVTIAIAYAAISARRNAAAPGSLIGASAVLFACGLGAWLATRPLAADAGAAAPEASPNPFALEIALPSSEPPCAPLPEGLVLTIADGEAVLMNLPEHHQPDALTDTLRELCADDYWPVSTSTIVVGAERRVADERLSPWLDAVAAASDTCDPVQRVVRAGQQVTQLETATMGTLEFRLVCHLREVAYESPPPPPPPPPPIPTDDSVAARVAAARDEIDLCYEELVMSEPELAGELLLRITVDASGATSSDVLRNGSGSEALAACATRVIDSLRWAERLGAGPVTLNQSYAFSFWE